MTCGRILAKTGLALAILLTALPSLAVEVAGASARLGWTAAPGPVSAYGVFLSRNGSAYSASPSQVVTTSEVTIAGAVGETYRVKVAAYDAAGNKGPESPVSAPIVFVSPPDVTPPPAPTPAALSVQTTSLEVNVEQGQNASAQSVMIKNSGGGTLGYLIAYSHDWIVLGTSSGTATTETDTIPVGFATSALPAGSYTGVITVVQANPATTPQTETYVPVNLTVRAPTQAQPSIGLSTTSMTASVVQGANAAAQSFTVRNSGGGTLRYSVSDNASWLAASPASGTSTGESDTIGLSFTTSGLTKGSYTGTVTVSATGLPSQAVAVSLTVTEPPPAISLDSAGLAQTVTKGQAPAGSAFGVRNSGGGQLRYTVAGDAGWLSVTPASGSSTGETDAIAVAYDISTLAVGTYSATVTVGGQAGVAQKVLPVTLVVSPAPAQVALSTNVLAVTVQKGRDAAPASFAVRNAGGGTLSYGISDDVSWLGVTPASGTSTGESDVVGVSFATASLTPGSYTGTITVSGGAGVASQTIAVNLTVKDLDPQLEVSATSLSASVEKGKSPAAQTFTVRNAGGGTLSYSLSESAAWLSLSPPSGTSTGERDTVSVAFSTASLAAGSHATSITVSGGAGIAPVTIPVTVVVTDGTPQITLSTTALSTSVRRGELAPPTSFTVRNSGGGTLSWAVAPGAGWLSVSPPSGTSSGESDTVAVSFGTAGLPAGNYSTALTVSGNGAASKTVTVSVTVVPGDPVLEVSVNALEASGAPGQDVAPQSFTVRNAGEGNLAYGVVSDQRWLDVSPASGASSGEADTLQVNFSAATLTAGTHTATLTVTGSGVPSKTIAVTLRLSAASARFDLDGDGSSDAMFRHTDGSLTAWLLNSTTVRESVTPASPPASWLLVGAGDFDGDGKSFDLLWMNPRNGLVVITLNDGAVLKGVQWAGTIDAAWRVGAVADFDADGRDDVLGINQSTGDVSVWVMRRFKLTDARVVGKLGTDWDAVGAGDFDGDGKADVLFERAATNEHMLWLMDGFTVRSGFAPASASSPPWTTVATGDYNGDGRLDVVASYMGLSLGVLTSTGSDFAATPIVGTFPTPTATVANSGDRNGDQIEDLLWFDPSSGGVALGLVDATQFKALAPIGVLDTNWKPVGNTGTE